MYPLCRGPVHDLKYVYPIKSNHTPLSKRSNKGTTRPLDPKTPAKENLYSAKTVYTPAQGTSLPANNVKTHARGTSNPGQTSKPRNLIERSGSSKVSVECLFPYVF